MAANAQQTQIQISRLYKVCYDTIYAFFVYIQNVIKINETNMTLHTCAVPVNHVIKWNVAMR